MARGAKTTQSAGVQWWTLTGGVFTRRVQEPEQGSKSRVLEKGPNAGNTIHEIFCDEMEGQVIGITTKPSEYGETLEILMDVSTEQEPELKFNISVKLNSGAAKSFLNKVPNIDFEKDLVLKAYAIFDKEKDRTNYYITPYQNGIIEKAFTRDNPNGLPELKKVKVNGQEVWDSTDQIIFYKELIEGLSCNAAPVEAKEPEPVKADEPEEFDENGDDLPF